MHACSTWNVQNNFPLDLTKRTKSNTMGTQICRKIMAFFFVTALLWTSLRCLFDFHLYQRFVLDDHILIGYIMATLDASARHYVSCIVLCYNPHQQSWYCLSNMEANLEPLIEQFRHEGRSRSEMLIMYPSLL